jgi:hypothetical protein
LSIESKIIQWQNEFRASTAIRFLLFLKDHPFKLTILDIK